MMRRCLIPVIEVKSVNVKSSWSESTVMSEIYYRDNSETRWRIIKIHNMRIIFYITVRVEYFSEWLQLDRCCFCV